MLEDSLPYLLSLYTISCSTHRYVHVCTQTHLYNSMYDQYTMYSVQYSGASLLRTPLGLNKSVLVRDSEVSLFER